ncbi:HTH domain-containing protein [Candidatus Woesearchaeota archaeon]|nr:HTH domain-containing protein [Candidatus Woesearchaeota archaeon]
MCKKALVVFSISNELFQILLNISINNLNSKQKKIIIHLRNNNVNINVTRIIENLSENLKCSKSTIWNNLKVLKKYKLIDYGSLNNKGIPINITNIGRFISEYLEEKHDRPKNL